MCIRDSFVAVQANMTDLCARYKSQDTIDHSQSSTEDRDDSQFFAGDHGSHTGLDRCFDFYILQGKIAQGLISHQHGNLLYKSAELVGPGTFVTQDGYFVLYQRMVKNCYVFHKSKYPFS